MPGPPDVPSAVLSARWVPCFHQPVGLWVSLVGQRIRGFPPGSIPSSSPVRLPVWKNLCPILLGPHNSDFPGERDKQREDSKRNEKSVGCRFWAGNGAGNMGDKNEMESPGSRQHPREAVRARFLPRPVLTAFFTAAVSALLLLPQALKSTPNIRSG